MGQKKGLEWNKYQLMIAKEILAGKTSPQISAEFGYPKTTIHKIATAMEDGDTPVSVSDEAIAAAPSPKEVGKPAKAPPGGNGSEPPPPPEEQLPDTGNVPKRPPSTVRFSGVRIECEYTHVMYMAQQCATSEWNWPEKMRFEDFIDTILYQFFDDRGITLQGYIVRDKVEVKAP